MTRMAKVLITAAISMVVLSCGGGSGGDNSTATPAPNPPPPTGGIEGTGIAIGPIDGFGSIFVNGIEFNTDDAEYLIDDAPGQESQLQVGQLVTVFGAISDDGLTGTADSVRYDSNVEGPVDSIDLLADQLVVLGQPVSVTSQTTFGDIPGGNLAGLNPGDEVRISGFIKADGSIIATRIDLETPDGDFEVRGRVSSLDAANMRFMIGMLIVDYSMAMLEGFAGGQPADGDFVEASGTLESGELVATEVELEDELPDVDEGDEVEVEGLVTRFVSATDFDVAGLAVTTTAGTTYENGSAGDLALDVLVEAEGAINAAGVLVADEIEFGAEGSIRMDGLVEAVDNNGFTVFTIPVTVTASTRIEDQSDADMRPFSLANLNVGDYVEVRGLVDTSGDFVATQVERDDPEDSVSLRGPVESVSDPDFVILGVTVSTSAGTSFEGTTSAEFFANANGRIVDAEGTWDGVQIVAESVEFED